MKIYARQVPFDVQESPPFNTKEYSFPDDIIVCGNRRFVEHTKEDFDNALKTLREGYLAC